MNNPGELYVRKARWAGVWTLLALLGVLALGLSACGTPQKTLDTLTQPEFDATRQRAMRRLSLASAYFEQGQNDAAQQEVRAALQIDPNYAEAYGLLGLIHQRNKQPALAQQSFEHALQLASVPPIRSTELANIQHNYGWFLCQQQHGPEAQVQLTRALEQPGYQQVAKTWMTLGLCQLQAGSAADARRSFENALSHDPANSVARYQLAWLAWQARDLKTAQSMLEPLNAGAQASAQSLWLGIKLAHAQMRAQEMQQLVQQLTQRFPRSTQAQAWEQGNLED